MHMYAYTRTDTRTHTDTHTHTHGSRFISVIEHGYSCTANLADMHIKILAHWDSMLIYTKLRIARHFLLKLEYEATISNANKNYKKWS